MSKLQLSSEPKTNLQKRFSLGCSVDSVVPGSVVSGSVDVSVVTGLVAAGAVVAGAVVTVSAQLE